MAFSPASFRTLAARSFLLAGLFAIAHAARALTATALFPANGAGNVCVDTPLRITFDNAPTVGAGGTVRIYNSADVLVDTINVASTTQTKSIGGVTYNYY